MNAKIELYLSKFQETPLNPQIHQKARLLNSAVLNDIGNQIIESHIVIPERKKQFKLKTQPVSPNQAFSKLDDQFNQIKSKKKALLEELQAVEIMQSTIKLNRSCMKQTTVSTQAGKSAKIRSQFTEEETKKIKDIYRNQKKFQRKIQNKLRIYQEDLAKFKIQKQEQERQKHRQLCMQKHEQRQKYIKQIELRNKQRQQTLNHQSQKILELKKKQKLFQKLQNNFIKQKQMQSEEVKRKLQEYKQKRNFSFDNMKHHQQQYLQKKRIQDEERQERAKNFKNVNLPKFPCLFLDRIKEQKEKTIFEQDDRKQIIKSFVERKTAYAEQVRRNLHQKIKTMSESKLSVIKQTKPESKWLDTHQKYQEGTKYMREVNQLISKLPRKVPYKSQNEHKPKFKNYLIELKSKDKDKKQQAKENVYNAMNNLSLISAKENLTWNNLAKSVKAKLEILNKLQSFQ